MSTAQVRTSSSEITLFPILPSIELICRVDSMAALRAAVDHGADCARLICRIGKKPGPFVNRDFENATMKRGIHYAHQRGCRVCLELDYALPDVADASDLRAILSNAANCGVSAVCLSAPELVLYMRVHHPGVRVHFITGDAGLELRSIALGKSRLGYHRLTLPRVISMAQLEALTGLHDIELELICSGRHRTVVASKQSVGTRRVLENEQLIRCADGQIACNDACYAEAGTDLERTLTLLPRLKALGVRGLIVEAPYQASMRMAQLTSLWREAIDQCQLQGQEAML